MSAGLLTCRSLLDTSGLAPSFPDIFMSRLKLRQLILALTMLSILLAVISALVAGRRVHEELLIDSALEDHRAYASKLAEMTGVYFSGVKLYLAYSAPILVVNINDHARLANEAQRLYRDSNGLSSVYVVDERSVIRAVYPFRPKLLGVQLDTVGSRESLQSKRPLVTAPYRSANGDLVVAITQPLFDSRGIYRGYVGGNIYLQHANILHRLIGQHVFHNGSYLYVVDAQRRLIYHPQTQRIGTAVVGNPVIDAVVAGHAGSMRVTNSQKVSMLAGYAPVAETEWGIVAQRPEAATVAKIDTLTLSTLLLALPLLLAIIAVVWLLASWISRPLSRLANAVNRPDGRTAVETIRQVSAQYFEAAQLKQSLLAGLTTLDNLIDRLSHESLTDPLTGLKNRRGMATALELLQAQVHPVAVVSLDVDHFKRINDRFGHDVGDRTLAELALLIQQHARERDVTCRLGGEEFAIFMLDTDERGAFQMAERLRRAIEAHDFPTVGHVTVSLGISGKPAEQNDMGQTLKQADEALYVAKAEGRNRTITRSAVTAPPELACGPETHNPPRDMVQEAGSHRFHD